MKRQDIKIGERYIYYGNPSYYVTVIDHPYWLFRWRVKCKWNAENRERGVLINEYLRSGMKSVSDLYPINS